MIKSIAHRITDFESLEKVPNDIGIEFDVHAYGNKLVIAHDAFCDGILFNEFVQKASKRFLAVNIKEEGIEESVLEVLFRSKCENFFLFDVSVPQLFRLGKNFSKHLAFRYSQLEKIDYEYCRNYAEFLWLDTFDGTFWPSQEIIEDLKNLSYKICFVSPELHRPPIGDHKIFQSTLLKYKTILSDEDLICTKYYL